MSRYTDRFLVFTLAFLCLVVALAHAVRALFHSFFSLVCLATGAEMIFSKRISLEELTRRLFRRTDILLARCRRFTASLVTVNDILLLYKTTHLLLFIFYIVTHEKCISYVYYVAM